MGYNSADHEDKAYVSMGIGFTKVGDDAAFKLGDIKPDYGCWSSGDDYLQVLNNTSAGVTIKYIYYGAWEGAETDEIGWWDSDMNDMFDDTEFPVGTAFLGAFGAKDVKFANSGSVLMGGTTLDYGPDEEKGTEGKAYVMFGNILPKQIELGDIKPFDGCWSSGDDYLQVLNNTSAGVTIKYIYYGAWEGAETGEVGWWDSDMNDMYNDLPVNPGDAWLGAFGAKDVKLAFPGALD